MLAVRFRESNLVRDVCVDSVFGSSFCGERRITLLYHFSLHSYLSLLLISLLVSDHLEVLDLRFRSWRIAFLHPCPCTFDSGGKTLSLFSVTYSVSLTNCELGDNSFHLTCDVLESRLELVDLFANLESRLSIILSLLFQLVGQV